MANIVDFNKLMKTDYPSTFVRGASFPLDQSSLYYSLAEAQEYARGSGDSSIAYVGQLLTVYENGSTTVWKINDAEGNLVQIDAEVVVDVNVDPADGKVYATVPFKSADPSKWTQSNKTDGSFYSVTYADGKFVAVGSSTGIWYSTDGSEWTQSNKTNGYFESVTYGDGKFVVTSGSGIWYSTNGSEWIQSNKTDGSFYSVTYADGKFIAVGNSYTGIWYSTNGSEWTQSNKTNGSFESVTYGDGKFVAIGDSSTGIWYSTNGSEWTPSNKTDRSFYSVTYGDDKFVATSGSGIWYSTDGSEWIQSNKTNGSFESVVYADGKFVAVGSSSSGIWYSTNGSEWTPSNKTDGSFNSVTYADGKFVAVGSSSTGIWYSTDGSEWTQSNKANGYFDSVAYGDGKFVAVGNSSTGIWYSDSIETTEKKQLAYQEDLEKAILGDLSVALERVDGELAKKVDKTEVATELAKKADKTELTEAISGVNAEVAKKLDSDTADKDYLKKTDAADAYTVAVTSAEGEGSVLKKYTITQGKDAEGKDIVIGTIDIPKDLVATEGELVNENAAGESGTFIKMTINNGDPFYIDVASLIEYNSVADTDEITLTDTDHVISATIKKVDASKVTYGEGTVKTALEGLESTKRDKDDNIAHVDSEGSSSWVFTSNDPVVQEALDNSNVSISAQEVDGLLDVSINNLPEIPGYSITLDLVTIPLDSTTFSFEGYNKDDGDLGIGVELTCTKITTKFAKLGESYVTHSYVDTKSTEALDSAKAYADSKSTADLAATKKYTDDKIAELDGSATIASVADGVVTIKAGITETDGKVSQGTGADITLAKVATTGKAEDVSIADAEGKITATTVEGALTELAKAIDSHHTVMTAGDTAGTIKYGDEGCGDNYQTVAVPYKDGENLGEAVTRLDGDETTEGSVDKKIKDAIEALDATASQTAGADGLALSITQVDGKVTEITGSIAAETYDAYGAAATAKSEVIGTDSDASSADTIKGTKKYAEEKASAAESAAKAYADEKVTKIYLGTTTTDLTAAGVTSTILVNSSEVTAVAGSMAMYNGELYLYTGSEWVAASKHTTELAAKADKSYVDEELAKKAVKTEVEAELAKKVEGAVDKDGNAFTINENKMIVINNLVIDGGSASVTIA